MPVYETFAKRKRKAERSGQSDVYQYTDIPAFLRRQIAMICVHAIGPYNRSEQVNGLWQAMCDVLEREFESFPVASYAGNPQTRCLLFLEREPDVANWLSAVEIACHIFADLNDELYWAKHNRGAKQSGKDALSEVNTRFREHGLGYTFESGSIIRVDNQYLHAEVVKPTITLVAEAGFEKANEDFLEAHKHYRAGETKAAIVAANRAFESTLKAVCEKRGWKYEDGSRAAELIKLVRAKGLFPPLLEGGIDAYIAMMKAGLPGVRNKAGGHGSSPKEPTVPDFLAGYAIHLTATNILLVIEADKALR